LSIPWRSWFAFKLDTRQDSGICMNYPLAFSPCPNDTFMMHGIMTDTVKSAELNFDISLLDIQQLNTAMIEERFDFCKVSSVAALGCSDTYEICSVGAALGFGVGPLLLKRPGAPELSALSAVLCPGSLTTAYALLRYFYPGLNAIEQRVFSEIMPALLHKEADYGVVIHEGRFTYQGLGLECVADLGAMWEERYKLPLPLGCFVAHKRVGPKMRAAFEQLVRRSIEYSYSNRDKAYRTMCAHAQELDDAALWSHVDLYVNQWSLELGTTGRAAFDTLRQAAG
jgi:1,4-dihydroxy-6-naphthoate synthase